MADETKSVIEKTARTREHFIDRSDLSQALLRYYFPPIRQDLQIPKPLPFI
jgi:hypothetical protein